MNHSYDHSVEIATSKVLIIDDDPTYRFLLRGMLQKIGVKTIIEAENGIEGLALAQSTNPDLILLDVVMPGLDGFAVCQKLRTETQHANTAILIQTGLKGENERLECFAAGATDVIIKPLNLPEFSARVRTHLRNALSARLMADFRDRMNTHLDIARNFIASVMPDLEVAKKLVAESGFQLAVINVPHDEIGGDLWYALPLSDGRLLILLLDASAHGLVGAMSALRIDSLLRELDDYYGDPGALLTQLDYMMAKTPAGNLLAGAAAILLTPNSNIISYAVSGNPPIVFVRQSQAKILTNSGMTLGSGLVQAETNIFQCEVDDVILLHSDGWPGDDSIDVCALVNASTATSDINAESLASNAINSPDDLTIITLRRL